jgi:cobalt-zinc-cadmium efflux system outer membrane protein
LWEKFETWQSSINMKKRLASTALSCLVLGSTTVWVGCSISQPRTQTARRVPSHGLQAARTTPTQALASSQPQFVDSEVIQATSIQDAVGNDKSSDAARRLSDENEESTLSSEDGTTLDSLISLALTNNPAIRELAATTQKAAGYRTQVGLSANPTVGYQGQQLADRGTDQHLLFAEQEIATANKLELNRRVQNEAVRAQLQELEAQKLRVATDIRTRYYLALGYQKQLRLLSEFRTVMDKGYELSQLRLKAAEGSKIDVLQTNVQRNEVDLLFRQTRARYAATWREIVAIAGMPDLQVTPLQGDFPESESTVQWDTLAITIVQSSPEYAAAQVRVAQARAELERHGVQAIPNLTVQLGAGVDNGTDSGMMNVQLGAPIPVFNKNQGNIAAARAEYCRAIMESQRIDYGIRARLASVSQDYETAREAVRVYGSEILPSAQESLVLAESAYKAGEMDFIQLLVARRTYFESSLQYVNAQAQLAIATAKIDGFVLSGSLDAVTDRSGSDGLRGLTFSQQ